MNVLQSRAGNVVLLPQLTNLRLHITTAPLYLWGNWETCSYALYTLLFFLIRAWDLLATNCLNLSNLTSSINSYRHYPLAFIGMSFVHVQMLALPL